MRMFNCQDASPLQSVADLSVDDEARLVAFFFGTRVSSILILLC